MKTLHTPGPWRWEFNQKSKSIALVGGVPRFDLTVMDFERWGMNGAIPRMRDTATDGMNIMHKVCDRPDWIQAFPGREHHADWCAGLTQPDLRLIAAAPDLLAALIALTTNPHIDLGDLVYKVRESEGEGWDGPCVHAWSGAIAIAKSAIASATGEPA